jgi:hypothetical protein
MGKQTDHSGWHCRGFKHVMFQHGLTARNQVQTSWKTSEGRHLVAWQRPSSYGQSDRRNSKWGGIWIDWTSAIESRSRTPRFPYVWFNGRSSKRKKISIRWSHWRGAKLVKDTTKKLFFSDGI